MMSNIYLDANYLKERLEARFYPYKFFPKYNFFGVCNRRLSIQTKLRNDDIDFVTFYNHEQSMKFIMNEMCRRVDYLDKFNRVYCWVKNDFC